MKKSILLSLFTAFLGLTTSCMVDPAAMYYNFYNEYFKLMVPVINDTNVMNVPDGGQFSAINYRVYYIPYSMFTATNFYMAFGAVKPVTNSYTNYLTQVGSLLNPADTNSLLLSYNEEYDIDLSKYLVSRIAAFRLTQFSINYPEFYTNLSYNGKTWKIYYMDLEFGSSYIDSYGALIAPPIMTNYQISIASLEAFQPYWDSLSPEAKGLLACLTNITGSGKLTVHPYANLIQMITNTVTTNGDSKYIVKIQVYYDGTLDYQWLDATDLYSTHGLLDFSWTNAPCLIPSSQTNGKKTSISYSQVLGTHTFTIQYTDYPYSCANTAYGDYTNDVFGVLEVHDKTYPNVRRFVVVGR